MLEKTENSRQFTEWAAVERLLNAYLRENSIIDPRTSSEQFMVVLKNINKKISGSIMYWSPIGHHTYGKVFYVYEKKITALEVIEFIIEELSFFESDLPLRVEKAETLRKHIENSITKTTMYLEHAAMKTKLERSVFVNSEQSLRLGHPFHPTPKSSEGFSKEDLMEFTPELNASFRLHYIAVTKECLLEEVIPGPTLHFEDGLSEREWLEVKKRLGDHHGEYKLLPLHPWQARYLFELEEVKVAIDKGMIVNLGRLGQSVYPTSSVRTVWNEKQNVFYKLPLHVRITNFIRTNSLEQVKRTMDAAKVAASIRKSYETDSFRILLEHSYRALSVPGFTQDINERLIQDTAVLLREGVDVLDNKEAELHVIASLLEDVPGWNESKLARLLKLHNYNEKLWLEQYLSITLAPMLKLFAETGVSLEAHVQNSLVKTIKGWPKTCYVRDLEGISISRERAKANSWYPALIAEESPVLYSEEEAWFRFTYYFVVNHLGHLISSLGKARNHDEHELWLVVRSFLLEIEKTADSTTLQTYANKLLKNKTLPAKANLISRFQECGETPIFVEIPNPIYVSEGEV